MKEIYVGNLRFDTTVAEVEELFALYGTIYSVDLFTESEPGRPHGYAFVKMDTMGAETAIEALDGIEFLGRTLKVETAMEQPAT